MPIKEIGLVSFRNHDTINIEFCPNINVIWGKNGSGKTAILEAIHSLSIGRSFRTNRKKELLKDDKEFFSITGKFHNNDKIQEIQINQTKDGTRRILIDGNKLESIRELVGLNPVVLLSPEEQIITKGSPQDQRNYFNKLFSIVSNEYFTILSDYNRILKQRNKLLDDFNLVSSAEKELKVWNKRISEIGQKLWARRTEFFNKYSLELKNTVKDFKDGKFTFSGELEIKMPENEKEYIKILNKAQNRDIYIGRTSFGPHSDKINFTFNGKNIKQYGSQGEHKLALLLIKLAEVKLIRKVTEKAPTILLDDL
ncbi:MAG: DNA replication and repair protein RecF, partial [Candidatus Marinimicrobia bacterium]|nr:DNA replication and repair protein RecF [Candidatus Neomarinimicrobiota bacterium]